MKQTFYLQAKKFGQILEGVILYGRQIVVVHETEIEQELRDYNFFLEEKLAFSKLS